MKSIKVFAPATVANVACGFDIMGFALEKPGDEVIMRLTNNKEISIKKIEGDGGKLSCNPEKNTVSITVQRYLEHIGIQQGVEIELYKKMPLGSGLGSSAASAVAGLVAINNLLDNPLTTKELLPFAMEGERLACGAAHADNVAPSLFGGFVVVRSYEPLEVLTIAAPTKLRAVVLHPHIELRTEDSRNALPKQITLQTAVKQWGNVAGLTWGLLQADYQVISKSLQDFVAEPHRAALIPHFYEVKESAISAGALGSSISGSGPSIFALCDSDDIAMKVEQAMKQVMDKNKISHTIYVSKINPNGCQAIG
jgi:homoserine kinase